MLFKSWSKQRKQKCITLGNEACAFLKQGKYVEALLRIKDAEVYAKAVVEREVCYGVMAFALDAIDEPLLAANEWSRAARCAHGGDALAAYVRPASYVYYKLRQAWSLDAADQHEYAASIAEQILRDIDAKTFPPVVMGLEAASYLIPAEDVYVCREFQRIIGQDVTTDDGD